MRHLETLALSALLVAAGGAGCESKKLPTGPSELASGIVVYEHANYLGQSAHITADIRDLRDVTGPCAHDSSGPSYVRIYDWNDCISSVQVAPGWRATLYRDDNYRDDSLDITADVPNLQLVNQHDCPSKGLNDCVTSIRVRQQ
jgi:Peptidase inhibitor family I36